MNVAKYASRYVERFGLALVPLPHAMKAPRHEGWNLDANLLRTVEQIAAHWRAHPSDGLGVCLEPSGLVSVDPDYVDGAYKILEAEGIDLDKLIDAAPTIMGRAPRLEFKAPHEVTLTRKAVVWPAREEGGEKVTVLEFRAGRLQDVLPPSIHPKTMQPYRWLTPPVNGFPELPESLLSLWLNFDAFKVRARNLCPWASPERQTAPVKPSSPRPLTGPSVIAEFNARHDVVTILEANGYIRAGRRRWKSPHGKNLAGVVQLSDGRVYCHHVSDPLGDEKAHDAFDVYAQLVHNGNVRAAVRTVAEALGMGHTA